MDWSATSTSIKPQTKECGLSEDLPLSSDVAPSYLGDLGQLTQPFWPCFVV